MTSFPIRCSGAVGTSVFVFLTACSAGPSAPSRPSDPGTPVSQVPSTAEQAERDQVAGALAAVENLDAAALRGRYPASFAAGLSYDPLAAANLPSIRASHLGLSAAEEQLLGKNGFVISDRMRFPGFTYGYASIYADDLPLFVSADSILYAVHRSYDSLLKGLEAQSLRPLLVSLLGGMRDALAAGTIANFGVNVAKDVDLYLAVPLGLLSGTAPAPVAGASSAEIASFIAKAKAAMGMQKITLFGGTRTEDFSQFTPRGHYTETDDLKTYFKAMMWLGRLDLRLIETEDDGSQVFHRPQFDAAVGLASLLAGASQSRWATVAAALDAFVGEADNMRPTDVPALLAALGVTDPISVSAIDDTTIAAAIVAGNFGAQRIASQVMISGIHKQAFPLSRSFLLFGQAYVIDSHVFSNVVYDRVPPSPTTGRLRMMPDPLDVGFAVFANNQAATLLSPALDTFSYAPALASMRVLADAHGDAFWGRNLYNSWLSSLRALSPVAGGQSGPFELTATEAWGRRLLNTQLASWAELRHDTILYAKQSTTSGVSCSFPDALVEPNPDFFARIADFASKGQEVIAALGTDATTAQAAGNYFANLATVATTLKGMAEYQIAGTPFSAAQMAFINQTVTVGTICGGGKYAMGWYPRLFFSAGDATDFVPTIADVHTEPTDENSNPVGQVLHVGTGYARLMMVTANACDGPRVYVGLASSYFEDVTQNLQRLDDPTWLTTLNGSPPADVSWTADLIAR